MASSRIEIETWLDEIVSYEAGMLFQSVATLLAKQKWPELVASEWKSDLGADAYALGFLTSDGHGVALACSLTATLTKLRSDAVEIKKHYRDVKTLVFATPARVSKRTEQKWTQEVQDDFGYTLVVMSREDLITSLMLPSNDQILRAHHLPQRRSDQETQKRVWNIPEGNSYFSGREAYLEELGVALRIDGTAAVTQAIKGLGGIGKTQIAIEYAARNKDKYQNGLWVVAESFDALLSGFAELAQLLDLPDKDATEISKAAAAASKWFDDNKGWLLILDNVEDLGVARSWLPKRGNGHVIVTTRLHSTGTLGRDIDLAKMPLEEATHFLLRRAKISAPTDSEHDAAMKIAGELDGLPLALEQAGAFIEDMQSSPAEYLAYYKTEGEALRARTGESAEHASVTATFSLAFAQLPDSAKQLVRLSAFLAADAIPEELLAPAGAGGLDFHRALASAGKFCLLRRKADLRVVDIHRLVQEVVRDEMNISERQEWANHAVEAVNAQFPAPEFNNWWKCERLLPHARAVIDLIKASDLKSESAGRLLTEVGLYLKFRARHQEAENVCKLAIRVRKSVFGLTNAATAESICNLGELYRAQRRFREAKRMLRRALAIDRRIFGFEHWETATDLNNLALTHVMEGDYRGAEPMLRHSLRVRGETLGDDNWHTAQSRNNLGYVCTQLGLLDEAKVLLGRAYEFREDRMGPDHPDTAETVGNLALLSSRLGHQEEAISLFERALAIKTKTLGVDHPDTVFTRRNYNVILGLEAGPDFRSP